MATSFPFPISAKRTYAEVVAKDEKTADDGHSWMRAYQQIRRAIEAVCEAYESYYEGELPIPTQLYFKKAHSSLLEKTTSKHMEQSWVLKWQSLLPTSSWER